MFNAIDLRALAERQGPERAFVSLYLTGPESMQSLGRRVEDVRRLLEDNPDEREHFEQSLALIRDHLDEHPPGDGSRCLFACWATGYLEAFPLEKEVDDLLWIDSSPYIRPLAELQDEYENFVVVAADNTRARIYFVTSAVAKEAARVRGDVKNDVKKGGWSQKRYERRRDKELQHYVQDVADKLWALDQQETFDRIVLIGSEETLTALRDALPQSLSEKLAGEAGAELDEEQAVLAEAFGLFFEEERASEKALWERIKGAYMQDGRAAVRPGNVLEAAATGRVEHLIVTRGAKLAGVRCRTCENLSAGTPEPCPVCGARDLFTVDLVNELVELVAKTGGQTEFSDPIAGLSEMGDVAALLRY